MKITFQNIRMLLQTAADKGLTEKQLLSALNQKRKKQASLKKALARLTKTNQCVKANNRYFILTKSLDDSKDSRRRPKGEKRKKSIKKGKMNSPNGIVLFNGSDKIVYSLADGCKIKVDDERSNHLFHGDAVRYKIVGAFNDQPIAFITAIVERKIKTLVGKVEKRHKNHLVFVPSDQRRFPAKFNVKSYLSRDSFNDNGALLKITQYPANGNVAEGKITGALSGELVDMPAIKDMLIEKKIFTRFPPKALKAAAKIPQRVTLKKDSDRRDLRLLPFITMDGEDAQDFDDAIYAENADNGFKIWISIADVADYVKPGSEIDKEAQARGVSVYLPGAVFPMLPEALCNNLCSLKEGLNRRTMTCEIQLDEKGGVRESKIYESMIRAAQRLTYESVDQFFITGKIQTRKAFAELPQKLDLYLRIAQILEQKRKRRGAIEFNLPETQFGYNHDKKIVNISKRFQTPARKLIEQFMLEANENVAKYCLEKQISIVWRNHPPPLPSKIKELKKLFPAAVSASRLQSNKEFNQALTRSRKSENAERIEYKMLRTMSLAIYENKCKGHFGLAAPVYCHFTSPIRRYPDLLAHRALKKYWSSGKTNKIASYIAENLTEREQLSTAAERASEKLAKTIFMSDYIGDIFDVKIVAFQWNGVYVEIDQPYVEGFVHFNSIWDDKYEYDERIDCIVGINNKRKVRMGNRFEAILTKLDLKYLCPELEWLRWSPSRSQALESAHIKK